VFPTLYEGFVSRFWMRWQPAACVVVRGVSSAWPEVLGDAGVKV